MSLTFFILKHLTYIHRKCAVVRTLTCVKWTDWWKMILSLALQWVAVSWGIYDIIRWATLECQYSNFIIFSAPMNIVRWTSSLAMPFCHWMTALIGREGFWGLIFQRGLTTETLLRVRNSSSYSESKKSSIWVWNKLPPNHGIWILKAWVIQFTLKFSLSVAPYDHNWLSYGQSGPSYPSVWVKAVQPSAFPWSVPIRNA